MDTVIETNLGMKIRKKWGETKQSTPTAFHRRCSNAVGVEGKLGLRYGLGEIGGGGPWLRYAYSICGPALTCWLGVLLFAANEMA